MVMKYEIEYGLAGCENNSNIPEVLNFETVDIVMAAHIDGNVDSITVKIGEYFFIPSQIENILNDIERFKTAVSIMGE